MRAQGGHILYGEVAVEEEEGVGLVPRTFQLILRSATGVILSRDTVAGGGRYRFSGVRIGEYILSVEVDGREVARIPIYITALQPSYIRRDIALQWKHVRRERVEPQDASAQFVYARSPENRDLFRESEEAAERGNLSDAVGILRDLVGRDPEDFEAWTELGTLHFRLEKADSAEAAYRRALDRRPGYVLAWLNLGKLYLSKGQFEAAVEALKQATVLNPRLADAFYLLGDAYLKLKKGSQAVEPLETALRLDPDGMADAHLLLGALYAGANYQDLAVEQYQQYLKKRPDSPMKEELAAFIRSNQ